MAQKITTDNVNTSDELSLVQQAASGQLVGEDFGNKLADVLNRPKELVSSIKTIVTAHTSPDEIAQACNVSDDLGVFAWVRSAVLTAQYMHYHNTKNEKKSAKEELQKHLNCGKTYFYRLLQAGKILLSGEYKKLAKSAQDFIDENTAVPEKTEITGFEVTAKIGEMTIIECLYYIYAAEVVKTKDDKNKTVTKYFYTSAKRDNLAGKKLEIVTGEQDGKPFTKFYDGKNEVEINYIVV